MKWRVRVKPRAGHCGLLAISAMLMAVAAPPMVQADAPQKEVYPPGALIFKGPSAESHTRTTASTNASGAVSIVPATLRLPPDLAEVVRLQSAGMEEQAILAFIQNSPRFSPITPSQIVYLKDLGVTPHVLTAMLEHQRPEPGKASPANASAPQNPDMNAWPQSPFPEMTDEETAPALPESYSETAALPGPGYYNPVDYGYVYGALAPYGSWVFLPGFGWNWQPTVGSICRDWRPYWDNGNWRWSECGWYWDSHYTWGQVPFHYGRWFQHEKYGWLWQPDRVWAPAWVSWRSSSDYAGWAPLPPGANYSTANGWTYRGRPTDPARGGFGLAASSYNFVNREHFAQPAGHGLGAGAAQDAFRRTTPTERNGFVFGADQRIVNLGIDPFLVETTARQAARPVAVNFPGGASFTDKSSGGQLPFNLRKHVEKNTSAVGGSASTAEEPISGAATGGGGPGAGVMQRRGHVPQYSNTRTVAEAINATAQGQGQTAMPAAAQPAAPPKTVLAPMAPAGFGKSGAFAPATGGGGARR